MAAGDPTGIALASGTLDAGTLTGAFATRTITFDVPVALQAQTLYVLVLSSNGSSPDTWCNARKAGNTYSAGLALDSSDGGSSWTQFSNNDDWFLVTGSSGWTESHIWGSGFDTGNYSGLNQQAQQFLARIAFTAVSASFKLIKSGGDLTGITLTCSLYLADTGAPSKATTPAPANAATDVTLDQATLTWVDGGEATSYNVYYGTESGNLTLVSSGQAGLSFTVSGITNGSPFEYLTVRYWRIDSVNSYGTTTGDEWSFTTIRLAPPSVPYWDSTNSQWYILLPQADGSLGDPPPTGVENTDYEVVSFSANFIRTNRILVAAANNKMWYEST